MSTGGFIYAIGSEGIASVKIGKTTGPVAKRLTALQIGHPAPLTVRASVSVTHDLSRIEKAIHRFLEADRQRGEWFAVEVDQEQLEALIVRAVQWLAEEEISTPTKNCAMMSLGQRVRKARRNKDLLQTDLATQAGVSVMTISRLEQGDAKQVYAHTVREVARALGVSADYLLGLVTEEHGHV
jgi:ribosome-binding protein aMBF1 (putative translation factor)